MDVENTLEHDQHPLKLLPNNGQIDARENGWFCKNALFSHLGRILASDNPSDMDSAISFVGWHLHNSA